MSHLEKNWNETQKMESGKYVFCSCNNAVLKDVPNCPWCNIKRLNICKDCGAPLVCGRCGSGKVPSE